MKYSTCLLVFCVLIIFANQSKIYATEDFQLRPPVLVFGERPRIENGVVQTQPERNGWGFKNVHRSFDSPLIYYSFGAQTESAFFDRRVNWASYSTEFVVDTGSFGFRYRSATATAGREVYEVFDQRMDVYGYLMLDFKGIPNYGLTRVGGGISYFDLDPYQGQEFLNDQHWAAFANIHYLFAELKFIMMIHDDLWNGGLLEFKIFNPFLYVGIQKPEEPLNCTDPGWIWFFNVVMPFEFGLTGSFGLPDDADGWGWYVKGRHSILFRTLADEDGTLSLGTEIYWSYRDGFSNTNVSGGWEFGIKFTLVGF